MGEFLILVGQISMWIGLPLAILAQIIAFIHMLKRDAGHALLALILPGYVLYYVWRSEYKMPRILGAWVTGFLMFVLGAVLVGLAMDM